MMANANMDPMDATFQFELTNEKDEVQSVWAIDVKNKKVVKGGVPQPSCTFTMSGEDFVKLLLREVQPAELFMSGKMKLELSYYIYESKALLFFVLFMSLILSHF